MGCQVFYLVRQKISGIHRFEVSLPRSPQEASGSLRLPPPAPAALILDKPPNRACTNCSESNSCRSAIFSPSPTNFTGKFSSMPDRDNDAALGSAVQLGQDKTGDTALLAKQLGLAEGVLAGVGIQHKQHLMRRSRNFPLDDTENLVQLLHRGCSCSAGGRPYRIAVHPRCAAWRLEPHRT